MIFPYGETEITYLTQRDPKLGWAIAQIGPLQRELHDDLFAAIVNCIIGQQISTAAQATIWKRLTTALGVIDAQSISALTREELQAFGLSYRKADYISDLARQTACGELDLASYAQLSDEAFIQRITALRGIGVWTAEMLLTFSLARPDILSYDDLAIQRGMRMLYHHRQIDRDRFAKYRHRYCPYATTASLYLWAIAGGAIPDMRDYAPKKKKPKAKSTPAKLS